MYLPTNDENHSQKFKYNINFNNGTYNKEKSFG